jgi:hypothetical protein
MNPLAEQRRRMTTTAANLLDNLTLTVNQEIRVRASIETTFAALLEQMGPANETPEGQPLPMKLEAWPGGRWYRDLGDNNGHFWGNVQAIKRPTLLEITGPLFASAAFVSNLQYRLTEKDGETLITFRHSGLGFIEDHQRLGVGRGWNWVLERTRKQAEAAASKPAA